MVPTEQIETQQRQLEISSESEERRMAGKLGLSDGGQW